MTTATIAPEIDLSTTQLPDPTKIDFTAALFTSRNRSATFLRKQDALTDFVCSLAKWLEKHKTRDILAEIPAVATVDPVDETTIAAQIIQLLAAHLYGERATLDGARLGNDLVDHQRQTVQNLEEAHRWRFCHNPAAPSFFFTQEDRVAWNLWRGLERLFGMNTVERCAHRLWLNHTSHAPLVAAAPIELIELWLAVPSTRPPIDLLRKMAADRHATNFSQTVASGIYLNFAAAFEQLSDEDRELVAAILRRHIGAFARESGIVGCADAMDRTLCNILNEASFQFLFHLGVRTKRDIPMALAFQVIFLAFYNASMTIPEDCRLPRGSEAFGEDYLPQLRKVLGATIVPEIIA